MSLSQDTIGTMDPAQGIFDASGWKADLLSLLEQGLGLRPHLIDGLSGDPLCLSPQQPGLDWQRYAEVCREAGRRGCPEFLDEEDPFLILALPFSSPDGGCCIAVATFLQRAMRPDENLDRAAMRLGLTLKRSPRWSKAQTPWAPDHLRRAADLTLAQWRSRQEIGRLERESQQLSDHLAATYEEISLLHRLTHNLKISQSDEDLAAVALEWLGEVLPAESLAVYFLPVAKEGESLAHGARTRPVVITPAPIDLSEEDLVRLTRWIGNDKPHQPVVVNPPISQQPDWPCPQVRELIAVPLAEGENLFGWFLAINHIHRRQFGTVEASLLASVAAILGIHSGNLELYRQQSELLAGVVRALTSAIDAKDPYTCGHSDRVARIAVRLARELGCSPQELNTIYLSGLLHDIGKIGTNDAVLRKPGKLTESEYEHIKQHVEIGHRILYDLKKLGDVLPVVLYHHESWDGQGYPQHLSSEEIPFSARIVSVADAYDAMGSNRPYRTGLPDSKIDEVFRAGAGKQWDPTVVAAFFRARDDLREIVCRTPARVQIALPSA